MDYEVTLSDAGFTSRQRVEKAAATLAGMLAGVAIDRDLNGEEIRELQAWLADHAALASRHPFSELAPAVSAALADGRIDEEERADLLWLCDRLAEEGEYWDAPTAAVQRLHGIFHGVLADGRLDDAELIGLQDWVEENRWLCGVYPYDELDAHLTYILSDGKITEEERAVMMAFFQGFIRPSLAKRMGLARKRQRPLETAAGVCAVDPVLRFEGARYCFTGASVRAQRKEMVALIEARGASHAKSVSRTTDYLVVGMGGNPAWAYACYGRKVEMAMDLRREGCRLVIVHEADFWDALA